MTSRLTVALWLIAGLACGRLAYASARAVTMPTNGFVAYYTSARLILEGENAERFYDDAWFREQAARFEPTVSEIYNANPPTTSLLLLPLAAFPYRVARGVWIAANFLMLCWACALIMIRLRLRGPWGPAVLSIALLSNAVRDELVHGQAYVLMLACLTVAWLGYRANRASEEGAPIGVMLATKTAQLGLWPLLMLQRRWRALAWGAGAALAVVLASMPWLGIPAWRRYAGAAAALSGDPRLAIPSYQTPFGLVHHLIGFTAPAAADVLAASLGLGALVLTLLSARRHGATDVTFAAAVLLGILVSPVSSEHHFTMAILPMMILAAEARDQRFPRRGTVALLAGMFLIAANLPYLSPGLWDGLWALLAYPRLYGTLMLWALALTWNGGRVAPASAIST